MASGLSSRTESWLRLLLAAGYGSEIEDLARPGLKSLQNGRRQPRRRRASGGCLSAEAEWGKVQVRGHFVFFTLLKHRAVRYCSGMEWSPYLLHTSGLHMHSRRNGRAFATSAFTRTAHARSHLVHRFVPQDCHCAKDPCLYAASEDFAKEVHEVTCFPSL